MIQVLYPKWKEAVTPNGGDINLAFDSGSNKIFAL